MKTLIILLLLTTGCAANNISTAVSPIYEKISLPRAEDDKQYHIVCPDGYYIEEEKEDRFKDTRLCKSVHTLTSIVGNPIHFCADPDIYTDIKINCIKERK